MKTPKLNKQEKQLSAYIFKLMRQYVELDKSCGSKNEQDDTAIYQPTYQDFLAYNISAWLNKPIDTSTHNKSE